MSNPSADPGEKPKDEAQETDPKPDGQRAAKAGDLPAAGPHAKPGLTNPDATPGTGLLPEPDDPQDKMGSTSS